MAARAETIEQKPRIDSSSVFLLNQVRSERSDQRQILRAHELRQREIEANLPKLNTAVIGIVNFLDTNPISELKILGEHRAFYFEIKDGKEYFEARIHAGVTSSYGSTNRVERGKLSENDLDRYSIYLKDVPYELAVEKYAHRELKFDLEDVRGLKVPEGIIEHPAVIIDNFTQFVSFLHQGLEEGTVTPRVS